MRTLYNYFRSSAAYRVRIALQLKNLSYEVIPVSLLAKEHLAADYLAQNPHGLVPALVENDVTLTQSLAICEYLDEIHPEPALLPTDPIGRAIVRGLALSVACEIHQLINVRVLHYLEYNIRTSAAQKTAWYQHWVHTGFTALEKQLQSCHGDFCYGNSVTLADLCLIPQVYNARKFECDLSNYPTIVAIEKNCMQFNAFSNTSPEPIPGLPYHVQD